MRRGTLAELAAHYGSRAAPRGEVVVVVGPPEAAAPEIGDVDARLDELLGRLSLRDAVAALAAETGFARRTIYDRALARSRGSDDK